jgi:hypothetical protein
MSREQMPEVSRARAGAPMKSKLILTYLDPELYKRFKRCQLEVGNFRHQHIVSKALSDWCDQIEAHQQTPFASRENEVLEAQQHKVAE